MAGYFTYVTSHNKPPADMAALAVSIMKSGDASPELRDWAAGVLRQEFGCAQASGRRRSSKRLPEEAPARRALGYPPTLH
ncbi:hypothetical protein NKI32_17470 [Mesorhizobium sp. M0761]|uniref:hypothetical protein n=1 Tax=unclassified Mesorhizobium TaxID=325217 RepID=UPI0003CE599B|nr:MULTISPECIES: hypothetical protein [unclassified Mesorhizobium]ESW68337.1 hypothetical protein X771_11875 [Mesorhizobium sp. LSJC277A00]ESX47749.1 hypothetical protein X762_18050 [Mesorhizobium sp. LSHC426A00]ESX47959.1 hypothetical protein X761_29050 [Mesorhizobium sp. LSHC424B00]ESX60144.1 hypothetical protein X760_17980 [Mesorhizobium sp. LSHC422A00]ESX69940.1 hypothetical protein X758_19165 [Mesorhizobium sp. LSHC416B00]